MNIRYTLIPCFILPLVILASQNATASKVYQWTDEEGGVHFSDVPPVDTTITDVREINIDIYSDDNVDPDRYSIINQVDRMAERRRQVTEERLAKKRLQLEEKRLALELEQTRQNEVYSEQEFYQPVYYSAYQQPYYFHQPRITHHQLRYPHSLRISHRGIFTAGHRQLNSHHSKAAIGSSRITHQRMNIHHSSAAIRF